ncbi:hypothetical protein DPMN_093514 [Dreissena polymorpha]|uniref:Uncharacterized protein n=1 Tax=Dreissena polymorpha TaxID=45954 RepID=A0A9D4L5M5_DREPO|nr:hypothetical protein DPMN_093514 [Dreissena polymorpha]
MCLLYLELNQKPTLFVTDVLENIIIWKHSNTLLFQKLKKDVHDYLTKEKGVRSVDIQVHEVGRFLRFRGNHLENVAEFLLQKGF